AATSSTNAASTVTVNAGHNITAVGVGVDVTGGGGLATINQTAGIVTGADGLSAVASNGAGGVLVNATGGSVVATNLGINAAGAVTSATTGNVVVTTAAIHAINSTGNSGSAGIRAQ